MKKTLSMPISGCHFVNQIAICKHLIENGYCPDLILGTSGGSIAGTMLLTCGIANIKSKDSYVEFEKKMDKMLYTLCADHYREPWCGVELLSNAIGYGKGAMFNRGSGVDFIKGYDCDLKKQPELLIGTYNKHKQCCELFSTRAESNSILKDQGDHIITYLDHDLDRVILATTASSAVPMIVPPVWIGKNQYQDGGVCFASPLGPCMNQFHTSLSYHIVYISPVRYSRGNEPEGDEMENDDVWSKIGASMTGMVTGLHIADRNNGIRAVCQGLNEAQVHKCSGKGIVALQEALRMQRHAARSFIELAPLRQHRVNFLTMKCGDVKNEVYASYDDGFSVHHWWVMHQVNDL